MNMKQILFTDYGRAELVEVPVPEMRENSVLVRTAYSAISAGTERANLTGNTCMPGMREKQPENYFPRALGYSDSGVVEAVGDAVTRFRPGDRVACIWGLHAQYQVLPENQLVRIPESVCLSEAALAFIGTFPLAAIRKTRLEIGESLLVVGLGILGQLAVSFGRAAGAVPILAVDPREDRRNLACELGADLCLNPLDPDFSERVYEATDRIGAKNVIEVTGNGAALNQALRCTAKLGRVALLGCTREPVEVHFYYDVHLPGIEIYGAHTFARPDRESYPHHWTHEDDCAAILRLISEGRIQLRPLIGEVRRPQDAPDVYARLLKGDDFPIGVLFDWTGM